MGIESIDHNNDNVSAYLTYIDVNGEQQEIIKVIPKKPGISQLIITDYQGNPDVVNIVIASGAWEVEEIGFGELHYSPKQSDDGISTVYFETKGNLQEVGVQFIDDNGEEVRQIIEKESDGIYVVGIDQNTCNNCYENFEPYIIAQDGTLIYHGNTYLSFTDITEITSIASTSSNIEINGIISDTPNYSSGIFTNIKKYIKNNHNGDLGYANGISTAIFETVEDLINTPMDLVNLIVNSGNIIISYYNGERDPADDYDNALLILGTTVGSINLAFQDFLQYIGYLTEYDIQFINGYVKTSVRLMAIGPGKLKGVQSTDRVVEKVNKVTNIGKQNKFINNINIHSHITTKILSDRLWTIDKIKDLINNPYKTGKSIDNLDGKTGDLGESASVFFLSDNQYIVINNKSSQVIQVSDQRDSDWLVDSRIYDIK